MDKYILTIEGRARFRRIKANADVGAEVRVNAQEYEFLDYIYEHESATLEEIVNYTGLSRDQAVEKLLTFVSRGYVKGFLEKQDEEFGLGGI